LTSANEENDDLRTRPGQFLPVERDGANYKETSLKGAISIYEPITSHVAISIENLGFHKKWDASDGQIHHVITGKTVEKFRAIGTEGDYNIYDVRIDATIPDGTAIIVQTYMEKGHRLIDKFQLGLSETSIAALMGKEFQSGRIVVSNIQGGFYNANASNTILLPYWKEHVVTPMTESEIRAVWGFNFTSLTLSPKDYIPLIGMSDNADNVRIQGSVSVNLQNEDAFRSSLEAGVERLTVISRYSYYTTIVMAVIAIILLWHFR